MKPSAEFHQELRQRILSLPGVTEWEDAGIHEDVFFVGSKMFSTFMAEDAATFAVQG